MISQFKLSTSDGQFFTLYNPSATKTLDLNAFELVYFNNNDLTKATSSKIIALSGTLGPLGSYMISDGSAAICYQLTVATGSLGFSTTSGFAEVLQLPPQTIAGTPVMSDYVGWSKSTSKGNDTLSVSNPATGITVPSTTAVQWYRVVNQAIPSSSTWQAVRPDPTSACNLQIVQPGGSSGAAIASTSTQPTKGPEAPATIISLVAAEDDDNPVMPPADIGLMAPQITELLPNPTGTGNDDVEEFIELYNPNSVPFDLSGLNSGAATGSSTAMPAEPEKSATPLHPLMLAVVGVLAVGYGIYEYRSDIAHKFEQLRRNRKLGRPARV